MVRKAFTIRRPDGRPVFSSYSINRMLFSLGVHVFVDGDEPECFHSHPAWAFRLVLWGGYVEEVQEPRHKRIWFPGRFGLVRPDFVHRIDRLLFKRSVSLWIRGPVVARIKTYGC